MDSVDKNLELKLIVKCKNGDKSAFGPLINIYRKQLFSYLTRLSNNKSLAEDLFQETLIKIWKGINNYDEQKKFSSWIFTIAHNTTIDAIRKDKIMTTLSEYNTNISILDNPQLDVEISENKKMIEATLTQLTDKQKNVFLLRMHSNMTFKEIAKLTEEPLNTVLSHMNYAVNKIKKILIENNVID